MYAQIAWTCVKRASLPLGDFHDLYRHIEVNQSRLKQRQRQFGICTDPMAVGWPRPIELQQGCARGLEDRPDVDLIKEPISLGASVAVVPAVPEPNLLIDHLIEVFRHDTLVIRVELPSLFLDLVRNVFVGEKFGPGRWRWRLVQPFAKRQRDPVLIEIISIKGLSHPRRWYQQWRVRPANEGARLADERGR